MLSFVVVFLGCWGFLYGFAEVHGPRRLTWLFRLLPRTKRMRSLSPTSGGDAVKRSNNVLLVILLVFHFAVVIWTLLFLLPVRTYLHGVQCVFAIVDLTVAFLLGIQWVGWAYLILRINLLTWPFVLTFIDTVGNPVHVLGVVGWGLLVMTVSVCTSPCSLTSRRLFFVAYLAAIAGTTVWLDQHATTQDDPLTDCRSRLFSNINKFLVGHLLMPVGLALLTIQMGYETLRTRLQTDDQLTNLATVGSGAEQQRLEGLFQEITKLKRKAGYVASLAHEVRTPLNALLSCCTLLTDTVLNEEQLDYVNMMITCGSQISNNVDYVLELARLDEKMVLLESKPVNLSEMCMSALDMVQHLAEKKGLTLEFICADPPPLVLGDCNRLKQIFLNLLTNSIKFTMKGSVSLAIASWNADGSEDLSGRPRIRLLMQVLDTGIGMTREQQAKLFVPFQQADSNTWGSFGGSGLGLVISQQLVQLMGGTIQINPDLTSSNGGTCIDVQFTLPMAPLQTSSSPQPLSVISKGHSSPPRSLSSSAVTSTRREGATTINTNTTGSNNTTNRTSFSPETGSGGGGVGGVVDGLTSVANVEDPCPSINNDKVNSFARASVGGRISQYNQGDLVTPMM